jgi:molecular chaperone GrpE
MNDKHDGGVRRQSTHRRTRADERIADLDTSAAALTEEIAQLKQRLEAAEQEAAENRAGWQRAAADMANFRRRTESEREQSLGLANESLLRKLLTVVDDFDRALAQMPPDLATLGWAEGIWVIDRKLRQLLESEGLTSIEAEGKPFDPHEHEAVAQQPSSAVPDGTVVSEIQRGYRVRDRVLRPAMVIVAKNDDDGSTEKTPQATNTETGQEATGGKE